MNQYRGVVVKIFPVLPMQFRPAASINRLPVVCDPHAPTA
jgi:hypothetical protein